MTLRVKHMERRNTIQDGLVYKRATIARRYLSTWFVPDVLGTIPIASLMSMLFSTVGPKGLQSVKLLRCICCFFSCEQQAHFPESVAMQTR